MISSFLSLAERKSRLALTLIGLLGIGAASAAAQGVAMPNGRTVFEGSVVPTPPQARANVAMTAEEWAQPLEVMISLRMRNFDELQARIARGETIPPAEMAAKYYPLAADYQVLLDWLKAQGLEITSTDTRYLAISVKGPATTISHVLAVSVARKSADGRTYISATSAPSLPTAVSGAVLGINGLQPENHPKARAATALPPPAVDNLPPYTPAEILKAYGGAGLNVTGAGQKIGIVIDTFAASADLTSFWTAAGVGQVLGNIENVQVVAGTLPAPSGEESLDVQWSSGIAPGAKVRVYATTDLFPVHYDKAFQRILDDLPSNPGLRQVSLSFGLGELYQSAAQIQTDSQYFASLAANGVTVFVSSGDGGSSPGRYGHDATGVTQAETPASDPNVTAVGGTTLTLSSTGAVQSESAWKLGGGAPSSIFSRPSWQVGAGVPSGTKRLVPDVASAADPDTGALYYLNGRSREVGGTSWSAPMWAGFCALINQARANAGLPSLGALNPKIYPLIGTANFRDIVTGDNGDFSATANYDLCTGVGVPNLAMLIQTLARNGTTGAQSNLTFFRPTGWTDSVVISNVTGTNTDVTSFRSTDVLYVDYSPLNNGTVAVPTAWHGKIYVDDNAADDFSYKSGLAAGYHYTDVLDRPIGPLAAGPHTIKVVLDTENTVAESNEADNTFQKTITVTDVGTPNLAFYQPTGWSSSVVISTVTGTNTDAATITSGDSLYLDYSPKNSGTATVGSPWKARIFIDDILNQEDSFPSGLLAGNHYTDRLDRSLGTLTAGTHTIKVTLDSANSIVESNEGDNVFLKTITVVAGGTPNLTFYKPSGWSDKLVVSNVTGTTTDSPTLRTTDTLYVDIAPWNTGTAAVPAAWHAKIFVDDVLKVDRPFPADLAPNYYYNSVFDLSLGSLSAGSHVVKAVVDSESEITESNESDNTYQKTIVVTSAALPNLTFYQPVGWSSKLVLSTVPNTNTDATSYTTSDTIYFDYAPLNSGTVPISTSWHVRLYVDEVEAYSQTLGSLLAGNYFTNQLDRTLGPLTAGTHVLRMELDSDDEIGETDETDNSFSRTITVTQGFNNLTAGVPVTGLTGALGSLQLFKIAVPAGQTALNVHLSGGPGDADLYVSAGTPPTLDTYDARGYTVGNDESVTVLNPVAGNYYILVHGFDAYSGATLVVTFNSNFNIAAVASPSVGGAVAGGGNFNLGATATLTATPASGYAFLDWTENGDEVSLTATYPFSVSAPRSLVANFAPLSTLTPGVPVAGLADASDGQRLYKITVPAGTTSLTVSTTGGTGDADLYIRQGAPATTTTFDDASVGKTTAESVTETDPTAGTWYVLLKGFAAYSGVTLQATLGGTAASIAVTASPAAGGTVSGGGSYTLGSSATLVATPATGFRFVDYTENGAEVSTSATYTFTVNGSRSLQANFAALGNFPINVTANPPEGGTVTGAGSYPSGSTVQLVATPSPGYSFVNYTENGNPVGSTATLSFPAAAARTLVANFTLGQPGLPISRGVPITGISDSKGGQKQFLINLPPAARNLVVTTAATSGDIDLYVKFGSPATRENADATSGSYSASEKITIPYPPAGDCYILLYGYAAYAEGSVTVTYDDPTGAPVALTLSASPENGGRLPPSGQYAQNAALHLQARPNAGFVFESWMENGTVLTENPSLDLTLASDRQLVANFTQAVALSEFEGTYDGLMGDPIAAQTDGGAVHLSITSVGKVTGYVKLQGKKFTFKGTFDGITYRLQTDAKNGHTVLPLQLRAEPAGNAVTGALEFGTSSPLLALKAGYSRLHKLPEKLTYTVLLPPDPQLLADVHYPQGFGYAKLSVSTLGAATLTGKLGDGTSFSSAASLSTDARLPVYAAPYHSLGVVFGWSLFEDLAASDLTGDLHWMKPSGTSGTYPGGFTGHIPLVGSTFVKPISHAPVISLPATGATITFTGPGTTLRLETFTVGERSRVTIGGANASELKLTLDPSDGSIAGSLAELGQKKPQHFSGMLLQKQSSGAGFFSDGTLTYPFEFSADAH